MELETILEAKYLLCKNGFATLTELDNLDFHKLTYYHSKFVKELTEQK